MWPDNLTKNSVLTATRNLNVWETQSSSLLIHVKTNEVLGSPGKEERLPSFGAKQSTSQVAGRGSRAGATLSIKGRTCCFTLWKGWWDGNSNITEHLSRAECQFRRNSNKNCNWIYLAGHEEGSVYNRGKGRLSNGPVVTQPVGGRARTWTQEAWILCPLLSYSEWSPEAWTWIDWGDESFMVPSQCCVSIRSEEGCDYLGTTVHYMLWHFKMPYLIEDKGFGLIWLASWRNCKVTRTRCFQINQRDLQMNLSAKTMMERICCSSEPAHFFLH